jgi:uncharacterized membrane protein YfcA
MGDLSIDIHLIFTASLVLSTVGSGGGLVFTPLPALLHFPVDTTVSASLFLNGKAAISAAITYFERAWWTVRRIFGALLLVFVFDLWQQSFCV